MANDTLNLSPHQSDDESLMRVRAPNSEADSSESLPMASFSDGVTSTPPGTAGIRALTRSTNPLRVPGPVIEDDLRARAAQAESAAERLLEELSEPDETAQNIHLSHSLVSSASTTPGKGARSSKNNGTKQQAQSHGGANNIMTTPVNNRATTLRQAAAFQDSPPYKGGSHSILERLQDNRNESSWWLKRVVRK
jgi:CLIP-associating protein 1/2